MVEWSPFPFPLQGWARALYKPNILLILGVWKSGVGHYHFVETVVFWGVHLHQSHFVGRILGSAGVVSHHFVEIWWTHFVEGRGCASPFCRDCKNHFVEVVYDDKPSCALWGRNPAHKKCVQNSCCHLVTNSPSTQLVLQSLQNGEAQPLHSQDFSLQNGPVFLSKKNVDKVCPKFAQARGGLCLSIL